LPTGLGPEGGQEIIAQVAVLQRWLGDIAEEDAVDVVRNRFPTLRTTRTSSCMEVSWKCPASSALVPVSGESGHEEDTEAVKVGAEVQATRTMMFGR